MLLNQKDFAQCPNVVALIGKEWMENGVQLEPSRSEILHFDHFPRFPPGLLLSPVLNQLAHLQYGFNNKMHQFMIHCFETYDDLLIK